MEIMRWASGSASHRCPRGVPPGAPVVFPYRTRSPPRLYVTAARPRGGIPRSGSAGPGWAAPCMAGEFAAAPAVLAVRQPTRYRAETPSLGAEQDRGGSPAGDAARHRGHEVRDHERCHNDEDDREAGDRWLGDDADLPREQVPEEPPERDPERDADDGADGHGGGRLPGDGRGKLAPGEPQDLQQRQVLAAAADRGQQGQPE